MQNTDQPALSTRHPRGVRRLLRHLVVFIAVLVGGVLLMAGAAHLRFTDSAALPQRIEGSLRIATHNVHYVRLRAGEGPWSRGDWDNRREALDAAFKALDADIVTFQEMESFAGGDDGSINLARDFLLARNPGYGIAASGDWRSFPTTQPIFYRTGRFDMIDQGWFFFSDTPDVIYSRTFNGSFPAFASWARFETRAGARFRVLNLHFDFASRDNRLRSAELVADRIAPWIEAGERVILAGDTNALWGWRTMDVLREAGLDGTPARGASYHWNRGLHLFGPIDHVMFSDGVTPLGPPRALQMRHGGRWPADHHPVMRDFRAPEP